MSNYKRYVFAFFICHPLNNPLASIKMVKKSGQNLHFQPRFLLIFYFKTATYCGYIPLFFVSTTIRHHYYRFHMPLCGNISTGCPPKSWEPVIFRITQVPSRRFGQSLIQPLREQAHLQHVRFMLCFSSSYPCLFQRPKYLTALLKQIS